MLGLGNSIAHSSYVSGAAPKLLDTSGDAAAAYSLRLLNSSYGGNAVTVRRAGDNAEASIGFAGGELDTKALSDHCGSNDGFVADWLDQSGNGNDATQDTESKQPKIYDGSSAAVLLKGGKPTITGVDSTSILSIATTISFTDFCLAHVYEEKTNNLMTWGLNSAVYYYHSGPNHRINGMISFATGLTNGDHVLDFANRNSGAVEVHLNGASIETATNTGSYSFKHLFNAHNQNFGYTAPMQEFILWTSEQSDNRVAIESDINDFYSIY